MALLIILPPPLVQVLTVSGGIHLMNYYHNAPRRWNRKTPPFARSTSWLFSKPAFARHDPRWGRRR